MTRAAQQVRGLFIAFLLVLTIGCGEEQPARPPSEFFLEVTGPDSERQVDIVPDTEITLGGEVLRVEKIGDWAGLVSDPRGLPMAAIGLRPESGPWLNDIFLAAGKWALLDEKAALLVAWCESEEEGRARADEDLTPLSGAQWGVVDGAAVQWSTAFTPGAGVGTRDGSVVKFLGLQTREDGLPVASFLVSRGQSEERVALAPNTESRDGLIRFQAPAAKRTVVRLICWRDNLALVSACHRGQCAEAVELEAGENCRFEGADVSVRLDSAYSHAFPVDAQASNLREAVMETGERQLRIREGETQRYGDFLLRLRRRGH